MTYKQAKIDMKVKLINCEYLQHFSYLPAIGTIGKIIKIDQYDRVGCHAEWPDGKINYVLYRRLEPIT